MPLSLYKICVCLSVFLLSFFTVFGIKAAINEGAYYLTQYAEVKNEVLPILTEVIPSPTPSPTPSPKKENLQNFDLVSNVGAHSVYYDRTTLYDTENIHGEVLVGAKFRIVFNNQRPVVNGYVLGSVITAIVAACEYKKLYVLHTEAFDHAGKFLFNLAETTVDVKMSTPSTSRTQYLLLCSRKNTKTSSSISI